MDPRIADERMKIPIIEVFGLEIKLNGPSFCHVRRIDTGSHSVNLVTWGTQKWKGAAPIFNIMARYIKREVRLIMDIKL